MMLVYLFSPHQGIKQGAIRALSLGLFLTVAAGITYLLPFLGEEALAQRISESDSDDGNPFSSGPCGNNILDPGEQCDVVNGTPRYSRTLTGTAANYRVCSNQCIENIAPYCGDGSVNQTSEQCDKTAFAQTLTFPPQGQPLMPKTVFNKKTCSSSCLAIYSPYCGDGVKNLGEQCDDGNPEATDSCLPTCKKAFCGDGILRLDGGNEECDKGKKNSDKKDAECRTDCSLRRCGDTIVDTGEQCDTGPAGGLGCTEQCTCPGGKDSCGRFCGADAYGNPDCCVGKRPDSCGRSCGAKNYGKSNCCLGVPNPVGTGRYVDVNVTNRYGKHHGSYVCLQGNMTLDDFVGYGTGEKCTQEAIDKDHCAIDSYIKGVDKKTVCWTCAYYRVSGCFDPATKILLSDGSERAISDIKAGDSLMNPGGGAPHTVEQVIESFENPAMLKVTSNGASVVVTQGHPMATKRGLVKAKDLLPTDLLLARDGSYYPLQGVEELPVQTKQRVLNVRIADQDGGDEHLIVADGIVTGDLTDQEELASRGISK